MKGIREGQYDTWKLTNPDDDFVTIGKCVQCNDDFYEGEQPLLIYGDIIHEDCFYDYAWKTLDPVRVTIGDE